jgi:hypothetical protein
MPVAWWREGWVRVSVATRRNAAAAGGVGSVVVAIASYRITAAGIVALFDMGAVGLERRIRVSIAT